MLSTIIVSPHQMDGRLLVKIPGEHVSGFEVTDIVRAGGTLVFQCEPREDEDSAELFSRLAEPVGHFAVTDVVQEGTSLVVQCQPKEMENDDASRSRRDDDTHVYYSNECCEGLSHHDSRLFYEDLR